MTRDEFIQQAMLMQMGNARAFSGVSHTRASELSEIAKTAVKLADEAASVSSFDEQKP